MVYTLLSLQRINWSKLNGISSLIKESLRFLFSKDNVPLEITRSNQVSSVLTREEGQQKLSVEQRGRLTSENNYRVILVLFRKQSGKTIEWSNISK